MIKLKVDDRTVEVREGATVLEAADLAGARVPRFCYHKCLSASGSCRLCAVEIEGTNEPVISCREPAREGMVVRTQSELARGARADALEFILRNHPLDCPVCDRSGECDLQDYYFSESLRPSRLKDPKVRKAKAQRIGPHVILDSERCVLCTRCVRFCEEIAGVHEIGVFGRGERSEIGVIEGRSLSNPYSLMTVDLCPVGALTSSDFRFKKRAWFLKSSASVCTGCAAGCSIWIDHEGGVPYRIRPRENAAVNGCLACDHGRMTYRELLPENRVVVPRVTRDNAAADVGWAEAAGFVAGLISSGKASEVAGVLSARSSLEDNAALAGFLKNLKAERVFMSGMDPDPAFADSILRDADRNPNSAGVVGFAKKRPADLKRGAGYVILDGLGENDLMSLVESRPAWVVLVSSSVQRGLMWADAILPKALPQEAGGTFVNRSGLKQRIDPIFAPAGEAKGVSEMAALLSEVLG
ncbi:MAG TPA: 2Fe-2S iron-sulfur cluster-binding protein [bacterium]|nr:2Fe-2S iron-sulfur cluster-binding protein [bacterium]